MEILVSSDLEVVAKYKELVASSLDGDSVYMRTKETLQDLFKLGMTIGIGITIKYYGIFKQ